ncbi:MAG TPA: hypothetical protein VLA29_07580 [Acidimicrobiia bacterium]|nr:hypothetical protein [Acidimicrobiia bacterium]
MMPRCLGGVLCLVVALTSCTTASDARNPEVWGDESVAYFDRLSEAYLANDSYGVLDFYTPDAAIEMWRGDNRGGWPIPELLTWNSSDLGLTVESVHLSGSGALNLVLWPTNGRRGAVESVIEDGRITREVAYETGGSLGRSLRAQFTTVSTYEGFQTTYASAWSVDERTAVEALYAPGAVVHDSLVGITNADVETLIDSGGGIVWDPATVSQVDDGGAGFEDRALFLGPAEYGVDPGRAVGVFKVTDSTGCEQQVAIRWTLEGGAIVEEVRYREIESFRTCSQASLPEGWWTGLSLPPPSDQVVTGTLTTPSGREIDVHNGTTALEDLLVWGLGRYQSAGLAEPRMDAVTFQPSRRCEGRSGRVLDDGNRRELFVCMYESDICTRIERPCDTPATAVRVAFLHELGHAWMIDNLTEEMEEELLEISGRDVWDDHDVPWVDRGVEYAADVLAWGLLEEPLAMVRIGSPPCTELAAAYEVLTGDPPPRGPASCP